MAFFNDNLNFLDMFIPPEGYETEFIEMTTFSLSLGFLAMIPGLIYAGNHGRIKDNQLLESSKLLMKQSGESVGKFRILYDGKLKLEPDSIPYQRGIERYGAFLLQNNCTGVKKSCLFHPKIMVFQFAKSKGSKNEDAKDRRFRIWIGSRNLTFSNYLEAGVWLEVTPYDKNDESQVSARDVAEGLQKFFGTYYPDNNSKIAWDTLKDGQLMRNNSSVIAAENLKPCHATLHFQDFYDSICEDLSDSTQLRVVSMKPSITAWGNNQPVDTTYVANSKDLPNPTPKSPERFCVVKGNAPEALHAKVYAIAKESAFITWIGSANCSKNGLHNKNIEVMLRIESECDTANHFPITNQTVRSHFAKMGTDTYTYSTCFVDSDEPENEDVPMTLAITIEPSYTNNKFQLTITQLKNTVSITPRGFSVTHAQTISAPKTINFPMTEHNFTNVFYIDCNNQRYRYVAPIDTWGGLKRDALLGNIMLDPIASTRELVPPCIEMHSYTDQAFERLQAHACTNKGAIPEQIKSIVRDRITSRLNEYTAVYGSDGPMNKKAYKEKEEAFFADDKNGDQEQCQEKIQSAQAVAKLYPEVKDLESLL